MRKKSQVLLPTLVLVLVASTACDDATQRGTERDIASESSARPPPVDPTNELPPGHPPLEGVTPQSAVPPVPANAGTGAQGLTWDVPEGWVSETPASNMRRAQYRVPGEGGDGECVVFYFGPGQGGDATSNALRWAEQFRQPDGSPSSKALESSQIEVNGIPVLLTSITGTYSGGFMSGSSETLTGYMLLGAIAEGPDANWFFKFTGPEKTLRENEAAFDRMIRSLRVGG